MISTKWNTVAIRQLEKFTDYIRQDSEMNANKVEDKILKKVVSIASNPEAHPPDKYKTNNDGSSRAFEMYHCRISYRIKKNEIRVIRLRYTKMNPLNY